MCRQELAPINFNVTPSFEISSSSHTHTVIPNYPSFPLDDLNESYVLPVPEGFDNAQKKLLDSLTVSLLDANKLERETREQSSWMNKNIFYRHNLHGTT